MNFSFQRPEDSPGFLLWQLTNDWQRRQRQALDQIGLTHGQFVVLASVLWLESFPENVVTQKKVCEHSHIDKMSMSDLTATLIKKKMLKRAPNKKDKRAYSLTLTEKGRNVTLKAIPIVEGIDAEFFSVETKNLVQLLRTLRHLS